MKLLQINYNNENDCCGASHILRFVQSNQSRIRNLYKEKVFYKTKSNSGLKQMFNYRLVFWDRPSSGQIPYIRNQLFSISGFMRVMTWNSPRNFFFVKVFPICLQITVSNLISAAIYFRLVICLCLHIFACNLNNQSTWLIKLINRNQFITQHATYYYCLF